MRLFIRALWPFVWRYKHDLVALENFTLKEILKETNGELRRCRATIVSMKIAARAKQSAHENTKQHQ